MMRSADSARTAAPASSSVVPFPTHRRQFTPDAPQNRGVVIQAVARRRRLRVAREQPDQGQQRQQAGEHEQDAADTTKPIRPDAR